jgi:hypothetical protein
MPDQKRRGPAPAACGLVWAWARRVSAGTAAWLCGWSGRLAGGRRRVGCAGAARSGLGRCKGFIELFFMWT